ncbi:MAG: ATP-dependent DNA helicase, partial [Myxococcota bacterium]
LQAVLGLPRDLPSPDDPTFLAETARVIVEAILASDGGAFVLCTSHAAVKAYARAIRDGAGGRPILAQGDAGRAVLLDRFRTDRRAVLVGTDSFWEGISVRGDGLRLVIIPRVPFRVPTEPLQEARHQRIVARGGDPFKALSLPDAVLKLRQGYGRLIRSHTDRGVVLILDRRIHDKAYGTVILRSLPPARRVSGPWRMVREAIAPQLGGAAPSRSTPQPEPPPYPPDPPDDPGW